MLSHSLGLMRSYSYFDHTQQRSEMIQYEGSTKEECLTKISDNILVFNQFVQGNKTLNYFNIDFSQAEQQAFQEVATAFSALAHACVTGSYVEQARRYQAKKPVLLHQSFWRHYVSCIIHDDKIYFVNRGRNPPGTSIYRINPGKWMAKSAEELGKILQKFGSNHQIIISDLASELEDLNKLEISPKYLGLIEQKAQNVGNCGYTNLKRAIFAVLFDLKENNNFFSEIDLNKLYQSFAWFDRLNNIDHHVAKYSQSISTNKWKPLLRYLQVKPGNIFQGIRWLYYAKYLLHKLLTFPIQLSPEEIIKKTNLALATEENNEIISTTNVDKNLLAHCESVEKKKLFQDHIEDIKNKITETNKINARMIEKLLFSMTAHQSSLAPLLPDFLESCIDNMLVNYPEKLTPGFEVKYLLNKNALVFPQAETKDGITCVLGTKMHKGEVL
ncbi:MAG: hypothetical protein JSS07_12530 [Proteobacteria bacterium]|nr:hypothetical protein [Pseudomonadota bacterium]